MGHLVQMAGLTVQNFLSAAVGMAVAIALIRGFVRSCTDRLGNFWVDLTRGVVRVLLPISVLGAIVLIIGGAAMSLRAGVAVTGLDGSSSTIALAPTASQEVIKELGTNGGGIFNANSAHPFENPNSWTNLFEIFLLLVIPVSLTRTFGRMVGNVRQGYVLIAVMGLIWTAMLSAPDRLSWRPRRVRRCSRYASNGPPTRLWSPSAAPRPPNCAPRCSPRSATTCAPPDVDQGSYRQPARQRAAAVRGGHRRAPCHHRGVH